MSNVSNCVNGCVVLLPCIPCLSANSRTLFCSSVSTLFGLQTPSTLFIGYSRYLGGSSPPTLSPLPTWSKIRTRQATFSMYIHTWSYSLDVSMKIMSPFLKSLLPSILVQNVFKTPYLSCQSWLALPIAPGFIPNTSCI